MACHGRAERRWPREGRCARDSDLPDRCHSARPTLPEILRNAGYYTAGFFTIEYLSGFYGFGRGFDLYRDAFSADEHAGAGTARGDEASAAALTTSPNVVALARRALESADAEEPVFLFAHLADPHYDFIPPPPWDTKFDPDYQGDMDGRKYYWHADRHHLRPWRGVLRAREARASDVAV